MGVTVAVPLTASLPVHEPLAVHAVALVAMGLWLLDNCDLEQLAVECARMSKWEFYFSVAPLRMPGGTGSPVNPIAIL